MVSMSAAVKVMSFTMASGGCELSGVTGAGVGASLALGVDAGVVAGFVVVVLPDDRRRGDCAEITLDPMVETSTKTTSIRWFMFDVFLELELRIANEFCGHNI